MPPCDRELPRIRKHFLAPPDLRRFARPMARENPSFSHLDDEELQGKAREAVDEIARALRNWDDEGEGLVLVASGELTRLHAERVSLIKNSCKVAIKSSFSKECAN